MPAAGRHREAFAMPAAVTPELSQLIQAFLTAQEKADAMNGGDKALRNGPQGSPARPLPGQKQQSKKFHEHLLHHAQGLGSALGRLAPFGLQILVSGLAYSSGLAATQVLGAIMRVSCANPVLGPTLGLVGVGASSVLAGHLSRHSRRQLESGKNPLQVLATPPWKDFNVDDAVLDALSGILLFKLAGGHFRRLLPSDLRHPGALGYTSVPIGASKYASDGEKSQLIAIFKRDGCHHCGTKRGNVIGDHIPPNKAVHAAKEAALKVTDTTALLNSLKGLLGGAAGGPAGGLARQAYYAQCQRCSMAQSALMRHGRRSALVFHKLAVPPGPVIGVLVGFRSLCDPGSSSSRSDSNGNGGGRKGNKSNGGGKAVESQPGIWTWITRMEEQPPGQDVFRSFEDKGLSSALSPSVQAGSRELALAR